MWMWDGKSINHTVYHQICQKINQNLDIDKTVFCKGYCYLIPS